WDTKFYEWKPAKPHGPLANWDQIVNGPPLVHETRDRIDFRSCDQSPFGPHIRHPSPASKVPQSYFAMVANSEWLLPAGKYQLRTLSDDGIRVYIDDKKVL